MGTDTLLTVLTLLTGHIDATKLAAYADSTEVPREVMWAVAWQESRSGRQGNNYIGAGITTFDTLTNTIKRVCKERGRLQVNPCYWTPMAARCSWQRVRDNYDDNVFCGGLKLKFLRVKYGSWAEAIRRYNGSGPKSYKYQQEALAYIGKLYLHNQ